MRSIKWAALALLAFTSSAEASIFMRLSGVTDPFAAVFRPERFRVSDDFESQTYRLPQRSSILDWFRPKPTGDLWVPALDTSFDHSSLSGFEDYGVDLNVTMHSMTLVEPIEPGDTLVSALRRTGMPANDREAVRKSLGSVMDLRKLQANWDLELDFRPALAQGGERYLSRMEIQTSPETKFIVKRTKNGFVGEENKLELIRRHIRAEIPVKDGLFIDAKRAGVPDRIIANLTRGFKGTFDMDKRLAKGDKVTVLYEEFRDKTGLLVKTDKILYGKLDARSKEYELYRFKMGSGAVAYFSPKGRNPNSRETLSRKPVKSGRLTSRFGPRRHPITKKYKNHGGIDYAAPKGTPIYAAGSGRISYRARKGAYGNVVDINHGNGFITRYAHMNAFKSKQKVGSSVAKGEVIGFVGTTGRSTGNHLHYEIHKNGKKVNPLKVKLPVGQNMPQRDRIRFDSQKKLVHRILNKASAPIGAVASN